MQHGCTPEHALRPKAHAPRRHLWERCLVCGASNALGTPESACLPCALFRSFLSFLQGVAKRLFLAPQLFSSVLHSRRLVRCLRAMSATCSWP